MFLFFVFPSVGAHSTVRAPYAAPRARGPGPGPGVRGSRPGVWGRSRPRGPGILCPPRSIWTYELTIEPYGEPPMSCTCYTCPSTRLETLGCRRVAAQSIQLERALRSLSPVGMFATPLVLVATHEERPDHPLQDLLPFQASFQVPTCGYLWWWFAAHTNLRFALPAYHPFHHEQL